MSTCENLDKNDKVAQWIKTIQTSNLNEQCDKSYPSNEEILHYVCGGHNLRSIKVMEFKKLPKVEEGLQTGNIDKAIHSTTSHNETKSLEEESLIDDINQRQSHHGVCDKDSNLQAAENNTAECHPPSTVPSQNKLYVTLNTNTNMLPDKIYIMHKATCYDWH